MAGPYLTADDIPAGVASKYMVLSSDVPTLPQGASVTGMARAGAASTASDSAHTHAYTAAPGSGIAMAQALILASLRG